MLYRNKKNGTVVDFCSEVKGGPWEPVETSRPAKDPEPKPTVRTPQKSRVSKKAEPKK